MLIVYFHMLSTTINSMSPKSDLADYWSKDTRSTSMEQGHKEHIAAPYLNAQREEERMLWVGRFKQEGDARR